MAANGIGGTGARNDVNPNMQFGMPQTPTEVPRTMGPAEPDGEQFCCQSRRVFGEHFENSSRPQAAGVKLHAAVRACHWSGRCTQSRPCDVVRIACATGSRVGH